MLRRVQPSIQVLVRIFNPLDKTAAYVVPHLLIAGVIGAIIALSGILTYQAYQGHGGFRLGTRPPLLRVLSSGPLPASWSLQRYIVRRHMQGQSNSCTGQVGSAMEEIATAERGVPRAMSAGYLYNQTNGGTDAGASFSDTIRVMHEQGDAPLSAFPLDGPGDVWTQPGPAARAAAAPYRYASWRSIAPTDRYTIETELRADHPIMIGLSLHDTLYNLYGSYAMPTVTYDAGGFHFNHAMVLVGFDPVGVTVLNSWGDTYGFHGLVRLSWGFLASAQLDGGPAALITAVPGRQFPHATAPFPVSAWESYARQHHTALIPYRYHGTLGRVPKLWWKTSLHQTAGAPVAREQWHPKYRYMSERFSRAVVYSWPQKRGDPVKVVAAHRLGGGIRLGGGADPYATWCATDGTGCARALTNMLNAARAQVGAGPLTLSWLQSKGTASCVGSSGHSRAMAASGFIWHDNAAYPQASFPAGICLSWMTAGQNVGASSGTKMTALTTVFNLMMSEPGWAPGCQSSHKCNILYSGYRDVGIGFAHSGGQFWITQDFTG